MVYGLSQQAQYCTIVDLRCLGVNATHITVSGSETQTSTLTASACESSSPSNSFLIDQNSSCKTCSWTVPSPKLPEMFPITQSCKYADAKLKDLATANATVPGIPQNDLTACRINGTEPDNGPFCSPIHGQNLWTGWTYGGKWDVRINIVVANDCQ